MKKHGDLKIVCINDAYYIAEVSPQGLVNAFGLDAGGARRVIDQKLVKNEVAAYLKQENLGELSTITVTKTHTMTSRELTETEINLFEMAHNHMVIAKKAAVRELENNFFQRLIGR